MKKYEVTDIPHPQYPWLHRIRALYSFRSDVQRGQLGGYVQSEDNLSQEGTCWLFDDAAAIEDAFVTQQAVMKNKAVAKGHCLVSGTAVCDGNAFVCDDAIVTAGNITGYCLVGGTANIHVHQQTGISPRLYDHAKVYGEVSGQVECYKEGVVLPGTVLNNPTFDTFYISDLCVQVGINWNHSSRNIFPPTYVQHIHAGTPREQRPAQSPKRQNPNRGEAR